MDKLTFTIGTASGEQKITIYAECPIAEVKHFLQLYLQKVNNIDIDDLQRYLDAKLDKRAFIEGYIPQFIKDIKEIQRNQVS